MHFLCGESEISEKGWEINELSPGNRKPGRLFFLLSGDVLVIKETVCFHWNILDFRSHLISRRKTRPTKSLTWFDNFLSVPRRLNTILYVIYSNTVAMSTVKRSSNNTTCRRNPERCEIKKHSYTVVKWNRPKITGFLSAAKWKQIIVFSAFS